MPLPMRMNLTAVKLKQLDLAATRKDPHFGEPKNGAQKAYRAPLALAAQIAYASVDKRVSAMTGDAGESKGHLTFRLVDLETALPPVVIKKGDLITEIGTIAVDYKVTEVRPSAHLRGRPNILMVFFDDNDDTSPTFKR